MPQSHHHEEEKRALSREIIVLNNHLMEAKITINKLREDNVSTVHKLQYETSEHHIPPYHIVHESGGFRASQVWALGLLFSFPGQ